MAVQKTSTLKKAEFSEPIYNSEYEVYFGNVKDISNWYQTTYELELYFKAAGEEKISAAAFAFYDPNREKYVMVYGKRPEPAIIAHECLHIAKMVLGHRGYEATAGNDEPEAYLLTFLVRTVVQSMKQPIPKPEPKKKKKKS